MGAATPGAKLGRYHVVKHLASGGMAEVLLARATGIEGFARHVVIKRIREGHAENAQFVQMFLNEARLAAQLHHHNIVQVHDIGQEGNEYFFAMEYVHGEDLRRLLTNVARHKQKVPIEHVVSIVSSVATALHHAHEQRGPDRKPLAIVHRDVSPANILVGYDGHVKVVDFGIAKAAASTHEATVAGAIKGKASYMAPEQCTGKGIIDRRTDVFALGIVLYELSTARRLFKGENEFLTMSAIVGGKVPPARDHRPDLPAELDAIMMKALALAPADRYQTAEEMHEALEQFANNMRLRPSTSSLAAYMKQQFGERPEPWLVEEEPEIELSVDFDGSASGAARPPSEAVEDNAIPETVEAMKSSPIMRARTKAATNAPPLSAVSTQKSGPMTKPRAPTRQVAIPTATATPGAPVRRATRSEIMATPAPPPDGRRKTITVQIPVAEQAAGAGGIPRVGTSAGSGGVPRAGTSAGSGGVPRTATNATKSGGVPLPGVSMDSGATVVSGIPKDVDTSWDPSRPMAIPEAAGTLATDRSTNVAAGGAPLPGMTASSTAAPAKTGDAKVSTNAALAQTAPAKNGASTSAAAPSAAAPATPATAATAPISVTPAATPVTSGAASAQKSGTPVVATAAPAPTAASASSVSSTAGATAAGLAAKPTTTSAAAPKSDPAIKIGATTGSAPKSDPAINIGATTGSAPKSDPAINIGATGSAPKSDPAVKIGATTGSAPKSDPAVNVGATTGSAPKSDPAINIGATAAGPTAGAKSGVAPKSDPAINVGAVAPKSDPAINVGAVAPKSDPAITVGAVAPKSDPAIKIGATTGAATAAAAKPLSGAAPKSDPAIKIDSSKPASSESGWLSPNSFNKSGSTPIPSMAKPGVATTTSSTGSTSASSAAASATIAASTTTPGATASTSATDPSGAAADPAKPEARAKLPAPRKLKLPGVSSQDDSAPSFKPGASADVTANGNSAATPAVSTTTDDTASPFATTDDDDNPFAAPPPPDDLDDAETVAIAASRTGSLATSDPQLAPAPAFSAQASTAAPETWANDSPSEKAGLLPGLLAKVTSSPKRMAVAAGGALLLIVVVVMAATGGDGKKATPSAGPDNTNTAAGVTGDLDKRAAKPDDDEQPTAVEADTNGADPAVAGSAAEPGDSADATDTNSETQVATEQPAPVKKTPATAGKRVAKTATKTPPKKAVATRAPPVKAPVKTKTAKTATKTSTVTKTPTKGSTATKTAKPAVQKTKAKPCDPNALFPCKKKK